MKHKIVRFTNGKARIIITNDFSSYLKDEDNHNLFINPDLKAVKGISPELWQAKDGKIVPHSEKERSNRIKKFHKDHVNNFDIIHKLKNKIKWYEYSIIILILLELLTLVHK